MKRNPPDRYTATHARAKGIKRQAPGLMQTLFQRKAARIARRRRGFTPGAIAASSHRGSRAMSAIASDVALALKQQGYPSAAAKKAAQRASGSDFSSRFREALNMVKRNPRTVKIFIRNPSQLVKKVRKHFPPSKFKIVRTR